MKKALKITKPHYIVKPFSTVIYHLLFKWHSFILSGNYLLLKRQGSFKSLARKENLLLVPDCWIGLF